MTNSRFVVSPGEASTPSLGAALPPGAHVERPVTPPPMLAASGRKRERMVVAARSSFMHTAELSIADVEPSVGYEDQVQPPVFCDVGWQETAAAAFDSSGRRLAGAPSVRKRLVMDDAGRAIRWPWEGQQEPSSRHTFRDVGGSRRRSAIAAAKSSPMETVIAFRRSGSLSVIVATPLASSAVVTLDAKLRTLGDAARTQRRDAAASIVACAVVVNPKPAVKGRLATLKSH